MGEKTGIKINFQAASWDGTLSLMRDRKADVHAGLFYNEARDHFLEYGAPLIETSTHSFTHESLSRIESTEELAAYRVGVISGDFVEGFLKERLPTGTVIPFETYDAIMGALRGGDLKVFAADTPTALFHLRQAGLADQFAYSADKPLYRNKWFVAATEGDSELIEIINHGMARLSTEEKRAIGSRWVGLEVKFGLEFGTLLLWGLPITAVLALFIGFVTVWNRRLAHEITERKKAESSLLASEEQFRGLAEGSIQGILVHRGLEVLYVNQATAKIFGYQSREEVLELGVNILRFFAPEERKRIISYSGARSRDGDPPSRYELQGIKKDQSRIWLEVLATRVTWLGETALLVTIADITERKRLEEMKKEFVSTVSHELRTPLTSIRGALGMLAGGVTGEMPMQAKRMIDIALQNSDRLVRLINDLLDIEKIESGKLKMDRKPLDLIPLVKQAIEANREFANQFEVELQLVEPTPQARVLGDADRLTQVMTNLLSNAAKFSPPGKTVEVRVSREEAQVRVSVSDQGHGIPEEFRERIFQKFAQADSSDTRQKGGTGLGLSITKAIIEALDGSINFETEGGKGTTFYFQVPELTKGGHPIL